MNENVDSKYCILTSVPLRPGGPWGQVTSQEGGAKRVAAGAVAAGWYI